MAATVAGTDALDTVIGGKGIDTYDASDATSLVRINLSNTGDVNGNGKADFAIGLRGHLVIHAADFAL